jgi:cobalt-zinc-cadmium efflux system outer membrane protein
MDRLAVYATVSTVAFSMATRADEPARAITVADAVRLALAHNTDSRGADEDVTAADGALVQSHAFPNPGIFLYTIGRTISPFQGPVPNQLGVTWTVPIGGKRAAGIESAKAALDGAKATRIAARRQVELEVVKAFHAVLLDQSLLEFARTDATGFHQSLDLNELRYSDGKIGYNDVLKLRIQVSGVDDTVQADELQLDNDRSELVRLVGEGVLATDFTVTGELEAPATQPAVADPVAEDVLAKALANRTDYQASIATERSLAGATKLARRTPIPDLGVLVDYDFVSGSAGAYDAELSLTIPLFDRNAGGVTQAAAAERKGKLATEALRMQIREDVWQAVAGWKTARARLARYDAQLLANAKESLDISRRSYEDGRGSLLDELDAESTYRSIEVQYRTALANMMDADATLRFVAGEELP